MSTPKPLYRYLSFILSICLGLNLFTIPIAEAAPGEAKRAEKKHVPMAEVGEIPDKLPKTKLELTDKRTKYSTRYLNPDGSFTEEIFIEPQFYQDPIDKKWKKIDKSIKASSKKPGKHENAAADFTTLFADESGTDELASIEKGGKSISLIPVQASKAKASVKNNEITYSGIYPNTDIRYRVKGDGLKEDIILHTYTNNNTFSFEVKVNGLKSVVDKDGIIYFSDQKGKKLWQFEKPYMTDASGKHSDRVTLSLRESNGKTFVDVIADQAFLTDTNTKYPVTIDPTVTAVEVLRDMFIASGFPASSYASNTYLSTGYDSYYGATRSLIQFYLPSLPSDSEISSATFQAYQTEYNASSVTVDLFRINSSWTNNETWNTQPTISSTPESTVTNSANNTYWQWNVTNLVKDWYNGVKPNYGLMLKQRDEFTSLYQSFNSVNSGVNTPKITVTYYVNGIGLESFWGYTKDGINVSNGNLVLQETDLSIPGRGVPVSVTRTYNSRKSDGAGMFGYGWTSNVETRLIDAGFGPITLIDADHTRHIFGHILRMEPMAMYPASPTRQTALLLMNMMPLAI